MKALNYPFWWLGGYSTGLMSKCSPYQQHKAAALGATLLVPALIWGFGSAATADLIGLERGNAIAAGVVCALLVLIMDRAILSSVTAGRASIIGLGSRMLLAVLGSLVFSHPLILMVSSGLIDEKLREGQEKALAALEARFQPRLESAEAKVENRIRALFESEEIASARLAQVREELKSTRDELQRWRIEADKEGAGQRVGAAGFGERWNRIVEDNVKPLEARETSLETKVIDASRALDEARAAKALAIAGASVDPSITAIQAEWEAAREAVERGDTDDLFGRFAALDEAILEKWREGDYGPGVGYLVLASFLLLAELLPLSMKLGCRRDEYTVRVASDGHHMAQLFPQVSAQRVTNELMHEASLDGLRRSNRQKNQQTESFLDLASLLVQRMTEAKALARKCFPDSEAVHQRVNERSAAIGERILEGYFAHAERLLRESQADPRQVSEQDAGPAGDNRASAIDPMEFEHAIPDLNPPPPNGSPRLRASDEPSFRI